MVTDFAVTFGKYELLPNSYLSKVIHQLGSVYLLPETNF